MLKDRKGDKVTRVCDVCAEEAVVSYWNVYRQGRHICITCSNRASGIQRRGKVGWNRGLKREPNKLGNWYINSSGYIEVWTGKHTLPETVSGYYREHRLLSELTLGRPLLKREMVHHIDGNKQNNYPYNLYVCRDDSEHQSLHQQLEEVSMDLVMSGAIQFNRDKGYYYIAPQLSDWLSKFGELLENPSKDNQQRSIRDMSPDERSTTIQKWSRIKRSEAPNPSEEGDDIVCSA